MEKLTIGQAQRLSAPSPFALLGTKSAGGKENFMAVSWWTYLSNHPPMLGACLSDKGYSGAVIRETGEFTLSLVGESLREAALRCGACSGRNTDKISMLGIETVSCENVKAPAVKDSRLIFECRLSDSCRAGDHTFYIAEIVSVRGDAEVAQLFAFDGYGRLDTVR